MNDKLSEAERAEIEFDLGVAREDVGERVRNQMHFADKGLAAMVLANGGALVALFTFIGNTVGKADAPLHFTTPLLWCAFAAFALGITLSLAAHIFAFSSQYQYYYQAANEMWRLQRSLRQGHRDRDNTVEMKHNERGNRHFGRGMICIVVALVCFISGSALALAGVLPS